MCLPLMATCPPDPFGAAAFAEAIKGHPLQNIAADAEVRPSMVTKWLREGNVPEARIDRLPDDVKRRYAELQAMRRGALVLERSMVDAFFRFIGWRPVPAKASLEPAECGSLTGERRKSVA